MIFIGDCIAALGHTGWLLTDNPSSEAEFLQMFKLHGEVGADGTVELLDDPKLFPVTWADIQAKKLELEAAEPMRLLRARRDELLAESDWTQGVDVPDAIKLPWATYRQALRDITETYSSLDDVVWPTKPE